jgi:outer membrane immunogenic protein
MMKVLLATSALAVSTFAASAADMAVRAPAPAMVAAAPVSNWTGFYIGIMGGYGWSDELRATVGGVTVSTTSDDLRLKGGFIGGTIGYNFQIGGPLVFGIEADGAWSEIKRAETAASAFGAVTLEDKITAFGSVTGRLGYSFGPALLYGKGGWAWANNRISASVTIPPVVTTASETQFHSGWTVGGGLEFLFAPNWSGKVEYMYADYGNANYVRNLVTGGVDLSATVHTIKGGINYHFNFGGGPVVARY